MTFIFNALAAPAKTPARPSDDAVSPTTLGDLPVGHQGVVVEVLEPGALGERLMEMGLTPQTPVRMIRRSLAGRVLEVELRGYRLSLRRKNAANILVAPARLSGAPSAAEPRPEGEGPGGST